MKNVTFIGCLIILAACVSIATSTAISAKAQGLINIPLMERMPDPTPENPGWRRKIDIANLNPNPTHTTSIRRQENDLVFFPVRYQMHCGGPLADSKYRISVSLLEPCGECGSDTNNVPLSIWNSAPFVTGDQPHVNSTMPVFLPMPAGRYRVGIYLERYVGDQGIENLPEDQHWLQISGRTYNVNIQ